jgi:hypothetical protein
MPLSGQRDLAFGNRHRLVTRRPPGIGSQRDRSRQHRGRLHVCAGAGHGPARGHDQGIRMMFWRKRFAVLRAIVDRATERGEIREGVYPVAAVQIVVARPVCSCPLLRRCARRRLLRRHRRLGLACSGPQVAVIPVDILGARCDRGCPGSPVAHPRTGPGKCWRPATSRRYSTSRRTR